MSVTSDPATPRNAVPGTVVPGLVAGTWDIDPTHSEVSFVVRHLMVSKVRGTFTGFAGRILVAEDPLGSSVEADIDMSTIDTRDATRDAHLRSADFFETDTHPTMTYRSTAVRRDGDDFLVEGELTLHGVTRSVPLAVEFNGVSPDPWGATRAGFSAETEINRKDFGIDISMPLDGGGVVVGDKIKVHLEIEAILQSA
jgi:polyisoprenoid-binding protein YceI